MNDGRRFEPVLSVRARRREDGRIELLAPRPGLLRGAPAEGDVVGPSGDLGQLEVLGVLYRLLGPEDAHGAVCETPSGKRLARRAVDAGARLMVLDPEGVRAGPARASEEEARTLVKSGPVFKTPLGGRYYARPGPDAPPFVQVGDEVQAGTTVALIEVMKTFNRIGYGGAGVPPRARVKAILPADGDDVEAGDVLLELEAVDA